MRPRWPVRGKNRSLSWSARRAVESELTHLIKNVLQSLLCQRRTFNVFDRSKFSCKPLALLRRDRSLLLPRQLLDDLGVVAQIYLRPNDQAGNTWTVVMHLREPFLFYVFEGRR